MTTTQRFDVDGLRAAMAGPVIVPGDPGYDEARSMWNGSIDRRPLAVARCLGPTDVVAALAFARERGLEVTVRGGGHSTAGVSIKDGAVMIDLSRLNGVIVDPTARRVRVGGGATLAQLDAATQEHGLATTGGTISHTGVGGLTLGGGMGWLTRRCGLAIDNLVSAQVVTADGRILRASADEHPDLFWALRGGGGNFGVVTEFEFRLHEVGPLLRMAMLFVGLDQGDELLRLLRDLVPTLPPDLMLYAVALNAPPAPFVPAEYHFQPGYALIVLGFGAEGEHAALLDRVRSAVPPRFEFVTPIPYVGLQQMLDGSATWGTHCYQKALYLDDLTDEAISVITEWVPQKVSPMSMLEVYVLGGAYGEVADDATAFGGSRSARYGIFLIGLTADPDLLPAERDWARSTWDALRPHSPGAGGYVNAVSEFGEDRVRDIYGAKYDRLAMVKAVYDPTNTFRGNANIAPA